MMKGFPAVYMGLLSVLSERRMVDQLSIGGSIGSAKFSADIISSGAVVFDD